MRQMHDLFSSLERSAFRRRFRLGPSEQKYLQDRGMAVILEHARKFIAQRLAPAHPTNDGWQTPMRGHPVFIAQHATATCCRGCLEKWHGIARGRELSDAQQLYVLRVIQLWLNRQTGSIQ